MKRWAGTLKLVSRGMGEDVVWVQKEWMESLVRKREDRYRRWWGGLEKFVGGGGKVEV